MGPRALCRPGKALSLGCTEPRLPLGTKPRSWVTVCNPDKDQHVSHSEVSQDQGSLPKCYVHFTVERGEECATLNSVTLRLPRAPVPPPFCIRPSEGSFTSLGIIVVVIVSVYFPVLPVRGATDFLPFGLRQGVTLEPWLAWSVIGRPSWPQTYGTSPAFASECW